MKQKNTIERWTIIKIDEEVKDAIVQYAEQKGYKVATAIKELTKKELSKWKKKNQEQ